MLFINYRRSDTETMAAWLEDSLRGHVRDGVFRDKVALRGSQRWQQEVLERVRTCDPMLALIGPAWLTATGETGMGLSDPDDWVRCELETALASGRLVFLVLVDDAKRPSTEELEAVGLGALASCVPVPLRRDEFRRDVDDLLATLRKRCANVLVPLSDPLETMSRTAAQGVGTQLAGCVTFDRSDSVARLVSAIEAESGLAIVGPSGSGKSALAREVLESLRETTRVLWLDADRFRESPPTWQAKLGLDCSLAALLALEPPRRGLLIADRFDQVFDEGPFANLAGFLREAELEMLPAGWTLLVTCRVEEWPRVRRLLRQHVPAPGLRDIVLDLPDGASRKRAILKAVPAMGAVFDRHVGLEGLENLAVLDYVVREVVDTGASTARLADVPSWWCERFVVGPGQRGPQRRSIAERLAGAEAEPYRAAETAAEFPEDAVADLVRAGVVQRVAGSGVRLAHDLYGDWVRITLLARIPAADRIARLTAIATTPRWRRSVRGMLNDHPEIAAAIIAELCQAPDRLEAAPIGWLFDFAVAATTAAPTTIATTVPSLWPSLERCPDLAARYLRAFESDAVIAPHADRIARAAELGMSERELRLRYPDRSPERWVALLRELGAHRQWLESELADAWTTLLEVCLEHWPAPPNPAAGWIIEDARRHLADPHSWWRVERGLMRALVLAFPHAPDQVRPLLRVAAGLLTPEEAGLPVAPADPDAPPAPVFRALRRHEFGSRRPQQEGGPRFWPVSAFVEVAWRDAQLAPVFETDPVLASELLLALSLKPPSTDDELFRTDDARELDFHDVGSFLPPSPWHGPFRAFLAAYFEDAAALVLRLGDLYAEREGARRGEPEVELRWDLPQRALVGGFSGLVAHREAAIHIVHVALQALELYLYESEADGTLDEKASFVLSRMATTATLGVLLAVAKKVPRLLSGPLAPLVAIPELVEWDSGVLAQQSQLLWRIGADRMGGLTQRYLEWNEAPHRRVSWYALLKHGLLNSPLVRPQQIASLRAEVMREWPSWPRVSESTYDRIAVGLDPAKWEPVARADGRVELRNSELVAAGEKLRPGADASLTHLAVSNLGAHFTEMIDRTVDVAELDEVASRIEALGPDEAAQVTRFQLQLGTVRLLQGQDLGPGEERWLDDVARAWDGGAGLRHKHEPGMHIPFRAFNVYVALAAGLAWRLRPQDKRWRRRAVQAVTLGPPAAVQRLFKELTRATQLEGDTLALLETAIRWGFLDPYVYLGPAKRPRWWHRLGFASGHAAPPGTRLVVPTWPVSVHGEVASTSARAERLVTRALDREMRRFAAGKRPLGVATDWLSVETLADAAAVHVLVARRPWRGAPPLYQASGAALLGALEGLGLEAAGGAPLLVDMAQAASRWLEVSLAVQEHGGHPQWTRALRLFVSFMALGVAADDDSRAIWEPMLTCHERHSFAVREFAWAWHATVADHPSLRPRFLRRTASMLAFVASRRSERETRLDPQDEAALWGMGDTQDFGHADERWRWDGMRAAFAAHAGDALQTGDFLARFVALLRTDGGRALLEDGLVRVADALEQGWSLLSVDYHRAWVTPLARLLDTDRSDALRGDAQRAYFRCLNAAVAIEDPLARELERELSGRTT